MNGTLADEKLKDIQSSVNDTTLRKTAKHIVLTISAGVSARKRWSSDYLRDFRYI